MRAHLELWALLQRDLGNAVTTMRMANILMKNPESGDTDADSGKQAASIRVVLARATCG